MLQIPPLDVFGEKVSGTRGEGGGDLLAHTDGSVQRGTGGLGVTRCAFEIEVAIFGQGGPLE